MDNNNKNIGYVNFVIDKEFKEDLKLIAKHKHTTVSGILKRLCYELRAEHTELLNQIKGK